VQSEPEHDLTTHQLRGSPGRHRLGSHVVGQRVIIRYLVAGRTGHSGGPLMTDVLGVCESWGEVAVVRRQDGVAVSIPVPEIVTGKPIPPRELVRHRVSARDAQAHSLSMWPGTERRDLGDWILRSAGPSESGRLIGRANSALAMGDPGVSLADATAVIREFYGARGRPPWAQVVADGEVEREMLAASWTAARPGEPDAMLQIASVPRVLRALDAEPHEVELVAEGHHAIARLGTASPPGPASAARAVVDGEWVGFYDLWTDPEHRGQGLVRRLLADLLDWAASRGATTAYLHVTIDNAPAIRLYDRLGFLTHHTYRYLTPG
jgi:N-acetylglutamate synthase